ncbi:cytochrome P450 [Striga asiatica]|uniref:Cytochrome P450 n=1 Tax=Striga asiatica TaxID=4170 RepID=A0A5A7PD88_STRAF|nr:cytochrome P450 [Striga asiatica]
MLEHEGCIIVRKPRHNIVRINKSIISDAMFFHQTLHILFELLVPNPRLTERVYGFQPVQQRRLAVQAQHSRKKNRQGAAEAVAGEDKFGIWVLFEFFTEELADGVVCGGGLVGVLFAGPALALLEAEGFEEAAVDFAGGGEVVPGDVGVCGPRVGVEGFGSAEGDNDDVVFVLEGECLCRGFLLEIRSSPFQKSKDPKLNVSVVLVRGLGSHYRKRCIVSAVHVAYGGVQLSSFINAANERQEIRRCSVRIHHLPCMHTSN